MRYLITFLFVFTCCNNPQKTLFSELSSTVSNLKFENAIVETDSMNIRTFEYMYNGGGVAVGDINNDGLADIYFTANQTSNKLFLNKGQLKFEDITNQSGVDCLTGWKTGVTMADVNGDGLLDIYVCFSGLAPKAQRANQLLINTGVINGIPHFIDKATEYGLTGEGSNSTQALFFDMDNDGDLDMFLLNHGTMFYSPFVNTQLLRTKRHPLFGNKLYRNDLVDGVMRFVEISDSAGIRGGGNNFGLGVAASDINNDGWLDLYVTNDYEEQDFLYLNNKDGTFSDITKSSIDHISRFGMGVDIADYNNDGLQDIIVMDMNPEDNYRQKTLRGADDYDKYQLLVNNGYYHQNMRNMLQLNVGLQANNDPVFSEIGQLAGVSNTDWSWSPLLADFDNDGWKDLYVTNGFLKDITNLDFIKFGKIESSGMFGKKTNIAELINKMPATKLSNYSFRNNGDLTFSNQSNSWGFNRPGVSNGAAYADFDNDGDLDIVVNNLGEPSKLYENHARESGVAPHFITLSLHSKTMNKFGIGAKVTIDIKGNRQVQELSPTRGYQSSVEPRLHFGLGRNTVVDLITVEWPGGHANTMLQVKADQQIVIEEDTAANLQLLSGKNRRPSTFEDISTGSGLEFEQQENEFVDTKRQFLLPWQLSRQGPKIITGDVDRNGLDDLFVGGPKGQSSALYLQQSSGKFLISNVQPWKADSLSDHLGACFFDADSDGDADLYVVSGGSEPYNEPAGLQDKIYLNDGIGNFSAAINALPVFTGSRSCVGSLDFDKDGDLDLFVGGYVEPGRFPFAARSYLLRNDSEKGHILFSEVTIQVAPDLMNPGMVTQATVTDINKDGWPDLMIAGEWMPIQIFINTKGKFKDLSANFGLKDTDGLWEKILADDIDGDGDEDFIIGALAPNTQLKAALNEPMCVYANDFDKNGVVDPVLCFYLKGKSYPYFSLDEITEQIPAVKKKFLSYSNYAGATTEDVFTAEVLTKSKTVKALRLKSMLLVNDGKGKFVLKDLPVEAQFSAVFGILSTDFDGDNKKDLVLGGNFFPFRVQLGREDAGKGMFLKGDGKGNYTPRLFHESGLFLAGDIRDLVMIEKKQGRRKFIASRNSGKLQLISVK
jgi:enediyne biosynthesis protein E4